MICPSCEAQNDDAAAGCFQCGQSLSRTITQGTVVGGRYRILGRLGRGGMGTVYKARDQTLDETVALKVLSPEIAREPDATRRFRSEIKLARRVRHPNVCAIHEYGEDGDVHYIVMELVEGTDLKQELQRRGPLPPPEAFETAVQVAEGLDAVHRVGIVHRDLKTSNVMRDAHGQLRLMDFGIAKRFGEEATRATATGHVVGTPEYMSPEQARGVSIDPRSDVYAMAIVVYELFTGRVPFRGDTPIATILQQIQQPPPLDGAEVQHLPPALVPVLRRGLEKDPANRYQTVREMIDALHAARDSMPSDQPAPLTLTTARPSPVPTVPAPAKRGGPATDGFGSVAAAAIPGPRRTALVLWSIAGAGLVAVGVVLLLRSGFSRSFDRPETEQTPAAAAAAGLRGGPPQTVRPPPTAGGTTLHGTQDDRAREPIRPALVATTGPGTPPGGPAIGRQPVSATSGRPEGTAPQPPAASQPRAAGHLQVAVRPWAEVSVDGRSLGLTPLGRIPLAPGSHKVVLTHPDFEPLERRVDLVSGETTRLMVDLPSEARARRSR